MIITLQNRIKRIVQSGDFFFIFNEVLYFIDEYVEPRHKVDSKEKYINTLVVEDCYLSRISIKHSLSLDKKIKVTGDFETSEDCIAYLKKSNPDVIVMDLELKGMNGIEAISLIKRIKPKVKIIILTNYNVEEVFQASMFFGIDGYILKSSESSKLVNAIKAIYQGGCWFEPDMFENYRNLLPKPDSFELGSLYNNASKLPFHLTVRELEVLKLVAEGKSNVEIGKEIIISANTAKAHVGNILNKMNVSDRVQAAVMAVKANII